MKRNDYSFFLCLNPIKTHIFLRRNDLNEKLCKICNYESISLFLGNDDVCSFQKCQCYKKNTLRNQFKKLKHILKEKTFPRSILYQKRKRLNRKHNRYFR